MQVLTVKEMREFDRHTQATLSISEIELMYRAGYTLSKDFLSRVKPKNDIPISVFAGIGNNGGDALVMALELEKLGYPTHVYIVGDIAKASDSFKNYHAQIKRRKHLLIQSDLDQYKDEVMAAKIIIDGISGIGLSRPAEGVAKTVIEWINQTQATVYAIDLPSGLDPTTGLQTGATIKADLTGVIGHYKLGNLLNDALDLEGDIKVLDIGLVDPKHVGRIYLEYETYPLNMIYPKHNSHKYSVGFGQFIGGTSKMSGSIQMSAFAGLKSGLGIAHVLTRYEAGYPLFFPELVIRDVLDPDIKESFAKASVVAIGPGLPPKDSAFAATIQAALTRKGPLVIDAGGLDYLDITKDYHDKIIVLTPHAGELARLLSVETSEIQKDPLTYLKRLTDKGLYVLLKGPTTIVAAANERYFLQAKNPGLATAGSGDVLTGIVAAFLAKEPPLKAIVHAVVLHAKAARLARKRRGIIGMTATDLINALPDVILKEERNVAI